MTKLNVNIFPWFVSNRLSNLSTHAHVSNDAKVTFFSCICISQSIGLTFKSKSNTPLTFYYRFSQFPFHRIFNSMLFYIGSTYFTIPVSVSASGQFLQSAIFRRSVSTQPPLRCREPTIASSHRGWSSIYNATIEQSESGARQVILSWNADRNRAEMTTRSEREKAQKLNEQHQAILSKMLREDDNKYCADCEAKGEMILNLPR